MKVPLAGLVVSLGGVVAVALAWLLVRKGWAAVWTAMGGVMGVAGVVALASERVRASGKLSVAIALAIGVVAGIALYVATSIFLRATRGWDALNRDSDTLYAQRDDHTLGRTLFIALLIVVPGEELFWRGLVQSLGAQAFGDVVGALLAWAGYIIANLASGSLPIILGVVVGGFVWGLLALCSGGILASLACHAVWTGLMIVRRPE